MSGASPQKGRLFFALAALALLGAIGALGFALLLFPMRSLCGMVLETCATPPCMTPEECLSRNSRALIALLLLGSLLAALGSLLIRKGAQLRQPFTSPTPPP